MVKRPREWENWNDKQRMEWLRKQKVECKGGRKRRLNKKDAQNVWTLMKKHNNMSLVADLLHCDRTTVYRFLKRNPMPQKFVVEDDMKLQDYPEMQIWQTVMQGYASDMSIGNYMVALRQFYDYMKQYHPERARPSFWTSKDALEWIYGNKATGYKGLKKKLWHWAITPIRSLALKAQDEFPNIKLGELPTKKTHRAKTSLAGHEEYYYTEQEVDAMIYNTMTRKGKALIAFLYNLAPRTKSVTDARIENLDLDKHRMLIKDKGSIWWDTWGMTDKTVQLLKEYMEERGYPKSGWLFLNGNGTKMKSTQINKLIKESGTKAGITDKVLTAKAFRKSFVENFFQIEVEKDTPPDPMILAGTGKGTQDQPKTSFCVGWSLKVLMEHYAPKMKRQIEKHRQKFRMLTDQHIEKTVAKQPTELRTQFGF